MLRERSLLLSLFTSTLLSHIALAKDNLSNARSAADALMYWYNRDSGGFNGTGWWNSAECITALADLQEIDTESNFNHILQNTFDITNRSHITYSGFYDDEGWWALAWIKAYDLTHEPKYLEAAEDLFDDMTDGWATNCNGVIWWDKDRTYVNAIANELFLSVAAHLAYRTWNIRYLNWALEEWEWFEKSGMINSEKNINDGLDTDCKNNGYSIWTYNQGVIVGALVELSKASFDETYITTAEKIAWAGIHTLTDIDGILHDTCESNCGGDVSQFKGVFVRNIAQLYSITFDRGLGDFLLTNAESIWDRNRGPQNRLGLVWSGPYEQAYSSTHSSALMALIAAAAVQQRQTNTRSP